jgi:hypothetical protein
LAELRIWRNEGLPADGTPVAAAPDGTALLVAAAPLVVPEGVAVPPHDAAITNANTSAAELPFFITRSP